MTDLSNSKQKAAGFFRRNWFKFGIIILLLYAVFQKDFSFQIDFNTPAPEHQPEKPRQKKPVRQPEPAEREVYTEDRSSSQFSEAGAVLDRFDFRLGGSDDNSAAALLGQVPRQTIAAFIERFAHVAEGEQARFGIPASIILAGALLQSRAGQDEAAREGNNFFQLPCTDDWQGAKNTIRGQCLRVYENAWTSFRDHSFFLTTGENAGLRQLPPDDFRKWARALEKKKLSGEKDWGAQLVQVIEQLGLDRFDR